MVWQVHGSRMREKKREIYNKEIQYIYIYTVDRDRDTPRERKRYIDIWIKIYTVLYSVYERETESYRMRERYRGRKSYMYKGLIEIYVCREKTC